ncbi:MAG: dUTP diphosphatase [Actinomycetota bacterium]
MQNSSSAGSQFEPTLVPVKRLAKDLPLPAPAHAGDAGIDLHARVDALLSARGGRVLVPTGVAVAIPVGFFGQVVPRSGLALKHGISLVNTPGIIDSGYRGELQVIMINTDPNADYQVKRGDRIAQLIIQRVVATSWQVVEELDGFDRGGGFGHSGR